MHGRRFGACGVLVVGDASDTAVFLADAAAGAISQAPGSWCSSNSIVSKKELGTK